MRLILVSVVFALSMVSAACSGSPSSPIESGPATADAGGGATNALANGTCVFTLAGKSRSLPGFATMNGSGNLHVSCAAATDALLLQVGNGDYEGPGRYSFGPGLNRGSIEFEESSALYNSHGAKDPKMACVVDVTQAPASSLPPKGSPIAGTFRCTAVPRFAKSEDSISRTSEGGADFDEGAFRVSVR